MDMKGVKSKVLKEIMDLMDQEDGAKLMKHPKLVAAKIEVGKLPPKSMEDEEMIPPVEGEEMPEIGEEGEQEAEGEEPESEVEDILADIEALSPEKKALLKKLIK